ncbi:MAG TPA: peptidylprolyl isomerase [Candidatus Wunengus sp. YC63]|uniref:peptidylprolyl isomerase n=1 Tax=unclassified Candidatus Wunengus TaxID=3367695 RepID=UPI00402875E0
MKIFIKYHLLSIFIVIIAHTISYGAASNYSQQCINSIKAIVDDEIITQEDVVKRAAIAIKEAQDRYRDNELMDKVDQILKDTLEEVINRKVLIKEATKLFGTSEAMMKEVEKDLDSFVKGAVKNVGSLSKYYEIAEAQGINPIEKKNELKEDIMIDKIMKENVHDKVKVQPKLLRRYYCENIDEFRQKKEVKLRHLMVKFSAHNNNKDETLSMAHKIMKRIEKGEDFSTLAKQLSDGPNTENGGLCTFEEVNELRKDLRDVVYSLKDNECSKIVESPVGYHIFKVELIKPEKIQEFEEVQDDIYKKLYREETVRLKKQYINTLKQHVFIKVIN